MYLFNRSDSPFHFLSKFFKAKNYNQLYLNGKLQNLIKKYYNSLGIFQTFKEIRIVRRSKVTCNSLKNYVNHFKKKKTLIRQWARALLHRKLIKFLPGKDFLFLWKTRKTQENFLYQMTGNSFHAHFKSSIANLRKFIAVGKKISRGFCNSLLISLSSIRSFGKVWRVKWVVGEGFGSPGVHRPKTISSVLTVVALLFEKRL